MHVSASYFRVSAVGVVPIKRPAPPRVTVFDQALVNMSMNADLGGPKQY